jgi:predicted dinucleotide-binding enzyme
MNIGIIGSGNVGSTLGRRWANGGHTVVFSSRTPDSAAMKQLVADAGGTSRAATVSETASACDVLLLSTPWQATQAILAGAGDLRGKILIDATNPVLPDLSGLEVGTTTSAAEIVAGWAPGAKVVKAFNTVGSSIMADANLGGQRALLFYCGDDASAKQIVHSLAEQLGFEPEDAGPLTQARLLEPFALLWISLAFTRGYGREFAFRVIRRN